MKKLIVLRHDTGKIDIYNYDENIWESPEEFQDDDGDYLINSNCSYMVVDKLEIKIN
jgi:hypothetical protein